MPSQVNTSDFMCGMPYSMVMVFVPDTAVCHLAQGCIGVMDIRVASVEG